MNSQTIEANRPEISGAAVVSLAIVTASIFVGSSGIPFTIPLIVSHFNVTNTMAGLAATLEVGGIALACLLYSPFVPRFDARTVCRASLVALIVLNLVTMLSPNISFFLGCRALTGIVAGLINVTTSSMAGRIARPERMFGILLGALGALGIALSLILPQAKNVAPLLGISTLNAIFALYVICLAIGLIFCWGLPSLPRLSAKTDDAASQLSPLRALPWYSWGLLVGLGCVSFGVGSLGTFTVSLGTEQVGLSVEMVGVVMMTGAIVRVGGPFLGSYLSSRFRALIIAAVVLAADAVIGILLSHSTTGAEFAVLAPILSASSSIFFPVLLGTLARADSAGRLTGMHTIFAMGGASIASFVGGAVSTKGDYSANGYVVAGGMIAAAVCLFRGLAAADRQRFGMSRSYDGHAVAANE